MGITGEGSHAWTETRALLVIGLQGSKARCKWVIVCHRFTNCNGNLYLSMFVINSPGKKKPGAMWIYTCHCFSSIHQAYKAKGNVIPCSSMLVNDPASQKGKCYINLCLSLIHHLVRMPFFLSPENRGAGKLVGLMFILTFSLAAFDTKSFLKWGLRDREVTPNQRLARYSSQVHQTWRLGTS